MSDTINTTTAATDSLPLVLGKRDRDAADCAEPAIDSPKRQRVSVDEESAASASADEVSESEYELDSDHEYSDEDYFSDGDDVFSDSEFPTENENESSKQNMADFEATTPRRVCGPEFADKRSVKAAIEAVQAECSRLGDTSRVGPQSALKELAEALRAEMQERFGDELMTLQMDSTLPMLVSLKQHVDPKLGAPNTLPLAVYEAAVNAHSACRRVDKEDWLVSGVEASMMEDAETLTKSGDRQRLYLFLVERSSTCDDGVADRPRAILGRIVTCKLPGEQDKIRVAAQCDALVDSLDHPYHYVSVPFGKLRGVFCVL